MARGGGDCCRAFTRRWTARHCALAAIFGTIAATAVAMGVTVLLRPARVAFAITRATSHHAGVLGAVWNFTLDATNPSRRAGVYYLMISVEMDYFAANGTEEIQAGFPTPKYQEPRSTISFPMDGQLGDHDALWEVGRVNTSVALNAYVTVRMQFKVGPVYTMPFEVTVVCKHVRFADGQPPAPQPVNCTGWSPW